MTFIPPFSSASYKVVTGTDPAAGAEVSQTVPAGKRWLLLAVRFQLVTDATAGTRQVFFVLDDGTTTFVEVPAFATQGASLTRNYTWAAPGEGASAGNAIFTPITPVLLPAGYRIRTSTDSLAAGDDFGAPVLYVVEFAL